MVPILRPCCLAIFQQVGQTGHFAVFLEDFADHRRRLQTRQLRQVAARFGMSGAHQHAAVLRHERENVAGLDDVVRAGILLHRSQHGLGAVGGGNAGGHAFCRLDRNGEIGAERRLVARHHQRQVELAAARLGQRQADQAAAMLGHEVDGFRRDEFGGQHQVALVLAVFLVHQDDHFAGLEVGDDVLYRADVHSFFLAVAQHSFEIARHQIHFQIDLFAGAQMFEIGRLDGVGNQVDAEVLVLHPVDRQAHAVDRDRALVGDIARQGLGARITSSCDSPTGANFTTSPTPSTWPLTRWPPRRSDRRNAFSRLTSPGSPRPYGAIQRFARHVDLVAVGGFGDHRQADAVGSDAVAQRDIAHIQISRV